MHIVVLLILAVIWGAVLIPPALKSRQELSPVDSIGAFRRQLNVLERTSPSASGAHRIAPYSPPAGVYVPTAAAFGSTTKPAAGTTITRQQARQRRRMILAGLAAAVPVTFLAAVIGGGLLWLVQLLADAALVGFVALLIQARNAAAERDMKVRFLPTAAPAPEYALRRSLAN